MKNIALFAVLLGTTQFLSAAVTITNFGTSSWTTQTFGNDFTPSSQTGSSIDIAGNASNTFAGLVTSVDISGFTTSLTLTGSSFAATSAGAFTITLFDSAFTNTAVFSGGSFSDLFNSGSTTLSFSSDNGVDFADISAVSLVGSGAPSTAVSGTLSGLTAVPEPSAYAAIAGVLVLGFTAVRRRRRA